MIVVVLCLMILCLIFGLNHSKHPFKMEGIQIEKKRTNLVYYQLIPKEYKGTILYLHGGAYLLGMRKKHWLFLENIVNDTQSRVIVPLYPLLPFVSAFRLHKQLIRFYHTIYKEESFVFMGDSAGASLCLTLLEEGVARKGAILICPWMDVRLLHPEIVEVEKKDPRLHKRVLQILGRCYAGNSAMNCFFVNPMYCHVEDIIIFCAECDIVTPDIQLWASSRKVTLYEKKSATHIWMLMEKDSFYDQLVMEVRKCYEKN